MKLTFVLTKAKARACGTWQLYGSIVSYDITFLPSRPI